MADSEKNNSEVQSSECPSTEASGNNQSSPKPVQLMKQVIALKVTGTVKWFNVKSGYGFINRTDTKEDVFVHQTAIVKNNPKKAVRSVGDGEFVEFDVVVGEKGNEAANVTGPLGTPVRGSQFAADKRRNFRPWTTKKPRRGPSRKSEGDEDIELADDNHGDDQAPQARGLQRRIRPRGRGRGYNFYGGDRRVRRSGNGGGGSGSGGGGGDGGISGAESGNDQNVDVNQQDMQRRGGQRRYFRRNFRGGNRGGGGGGGGSGGGQQGGSRRPRNEEHDGNNQDGGNRGDGPRGPPRRRNPKYRRNRRKTDEGGAAGADHQASQQNAVSNEKASGSGHELQNTVAESTA